MKVKTRLLDELLSVKLDEYLKFREWDGFEQDTAQDSYTKGWEECAELLRKVARREYLRGKIFGINAVVAAIEDIEGDFRGHVGDEYEELETLDEELTEELGEEELVL